MPGFSVSGGGDINGDGFPDLIVGAPLGVPRNGTGKAYVIYGGDPGRLMIADSGLSAHFTDVDGDRVTVTTSVGDVHRRDVRLARGRTRFPTRKNSTSQARPSQKRTSHFPPRGRMQRAMM
jgi:hypothetical protein